MKETQTPFYRKLESLNERIEVYKRLYLNRKPTMVKQMEDQFKELEIRKEKQREKELEARRNAKREMNKSSGSFSSMKIKKVTRRKS